MRTPNCKCVICGKSLYRRPRELAKVRWVACLEHRDDAKRMFPVTEAQKRALELGREKGTNHLSGIPKSESSNKKRSISIKRKLEQCPEIAIERGKKIRGENHYRWNGGSSILNVSIRAMTENRKWGDAIKERDKVCVRCGSIEDLESHHLVSLAEIIEDYQIKNRQDARECDALWDLSNGITLCRKCHCEIHGIKYTPNGVGRRRKPKKIRRSFVGENNPNYRGGKISKICPYCGCIYYVKPSEVDKRKFCSRRCANENRRKKI